jgi:hypothetical protein
LHSRSSAPQHEYPSPSGTKLAFDGFSKKSSSPTLIEFPDGLGSVGAGGSADVPCHSVTSPNKKARPGKTIEN